MQPSRTKFQEGSPWSREPYWRVASASEVRAVPAALVSSPAFRSGLDLPGEPHALPRRTSFMDLLLLLKAAILGIVEGATEFLPVSSTGHLIIVGDWLGLTGQQVETFDIVIQLGAILAIAWIYREKIARVVRTLPSSPTSQRLTLNIALAFLPIAIVGFLAASWIKLHLFSPTTVAAALVVGGIIMLIIEWWRPPTPIEDVDDIPVRTAFWIGVIQVLALFPGTSRAGATIMGAYALGCSRRAATEFSFFLALPVMFAATGYELWDSRHLLTMADFPFFAVGFMVSYVTALIVVRLFLRFVSNHTFVPFAWYRIILGGLLLVLYGLG
jgi:undecaprenyl-diphosphatase